MATYEEVSDMDNVTTPTSDYPSPTSLARSTYSAEPEQPQPSGRKKRKAWGQPVPPINPILPPRKRAKTVEEKEQRKNERILRNRRAADKSRQRQKAAVADLEQRQIQIEAENKQLKAILEQYQSQFGKIPGCDFVPQPDEPSTGISSLPPATLSTLTTDFATIAEVPESDAFDTADGAAVTPVLTVSSPATSFYQPSPSLGPALNLGEAAIFPGHVNLSGVTQYPAAILCDLQCQPESLTSRLRSMQPNQQFYEVLTLIHSLTTWITFSETMPLMRQAFHFLTRILSTSTQLESLIHTNFHLIHILISMPSTTTQPAIFRSRLLSRLLACNPELARLLETAADESLQRTVGKDGWVDDAESRWIWASLVAIKWSVRRMERDHHHIRADLRAGVLDRDKWSKESAVDVRSVETTLRLWDAAGRPVQPECSNSITGDEKFRPASQTKVH